MRIGSDADISVSPSLLQQPVERILSFLNTAVTENRRFLIAMAGVPGSGKSTLAAQFEAEVDHRAGSGLFVALAMDGFHYSKAKLRSMLDPDAAMARRGAPWTFNAAELQARLVLLKNGDTAVAWPGFEHEIGDPIEAAVTVPASVRVILVEGLYLMHPADGWETIGPLFDERWYLDTPFEVAMERLVGRHMKAWGITREEAVERIARNDGLNGRIVEATRSYADWLCTA